MRQGESYEPLRPGLPNARRSAPGWQAAWAMIYGDNCQPMTHAEAVAEYDRIGLEEDARRSAQRALPLRGGA